MQKLRQFKDRHGLSLEATGDIFGFSGSHVSAILSGKRQLSEHEQAHFSGIIDLYEAGEWRAMARQLTKADLAQLQQIYSERRGRLAMRFNLNPSHFTKMLSGYKPITLATSYGIILQMHRDSVRFPGDQQAVEVAEQSLGLDKQSEPEPIVQDEAEPEYLKAARSIHSNLVFLKNRCKELEQENAQLKQQLADIRPATVTDQQRAHLNACMRSLGARMAGDSKDGRWYQLVWSDLHERLGTSDINDITTPAQLAKALDWVANKAKVFSCILPAYAPELPGVSNG